MSRYAAFTNDLVDLVLGNGGSLKAEHGTGRIMAPFVRRQYGDELYDVMWTLKRLVDPHAMLNPGSVRPTTRGPTCGTSRSTPGVEDGRSSTDASSAATASRAAPAGT